MEHAGLELRFRVFSTVFNGHIKQPQDEEDNIQSDVVLEIVG